MTKREVAPWQVRDMPLKVFKEQYGADIKSVMLKDMEERLAASVAAGKLAATGLKTRTGANGLPATQARLSVAMRVCLVHTLSLSSLVLKLVLEAHEHTQRITQETIADTCFILTCSPILRAS